MRTRRTTRKTCSCRGERHARSERGGRCDRPPVASATPRRVARLRRECRHRRTCRPPACETFRRRHRSTVRKEAIGNGRRGGGYEVWAINRRIMEKLGCLSVFTRWSPAPRAVAARQRIRAATLLWHCPCTRPPSCGISKAWPLRVSGQWNGHASPVSRSYRPRLTEFRLSARSSSRRSSPDLKHTGNPRSLR
jgi:hypothetical protein